MNGKKIGVGLIGTGWWAGYGHIPLLKTLDNFEFAAVFSRDEAKANRMKEELGAKHAFHDIDALLNCEDVDLVVVVSPGPTHAPISKRAIEAGKDVYTEWPLSTSIQESEELLRLAKEKGVRTLVGMQRRLAPSARYLYDLIHKERYVGELLSVDLRVGVDAIGEELPESVKWVTKPDSYTNPVTIYTAHFGNLLFSIVGQPKKVLSFAKSNFEHFKIKETGERIKNEHPTEAVMIGVLEENDALFSFTVEGGQKYSTGVDLLITGTKGAIKLLNVRAFENKDDNNLIGMNGDDVEFHDLPVPDSYKYLADTGLDVSVQDLGYLYTAYASDKFEGTNLASTYEDAIRMQRFLDGILKSKI